MECTEHKISIVVNTNNSVIDNLIYYRINISNKNHNIQCLLIQYNYFKI